MMFALAAAPDTKKLKDAGAGQAEVAEEPGVNPRTMGEALNARRRGGESAE